MSRGGDLSSLAPDEHPGITSPTNIIERGRVLKAPASTADSVMVASVFFSLSHRWEVPAKNWDAKPGGELPVVGTICCLVFDNSGDVWMSSWRRA